MLNQATTYKRRYAEFLRAHGGAHEMGGRARDATTAAASRRRRAALDPSAAELLERLEDELPAETLGWCASPSYSVLFSYSLHCATAYCSLAAYCPTAYFLSYGVRFLSRPSPTRARLVLSVR